MLALREPLQVAALEAALAAVVRHHDALRLRFTAAAGGWRQQYAESPEMPRVEREDMRAVPVAGYSGAGMAAIWSRLRCRVARWVSQS